MNAILYVYMFINIHVYIHIIVKYPLSAGFPSPSGGVAPWAPPLGAFGSPVGKPPPSAAVKDE